MKHDLFEAQSRDPPLIADIKPFNTKRHCFLELKRRTMSSIGVRSQTFAARERTGHLGVGCVLMHVQTLQKPSPPYPQIYKCKVNAIPCTPLPSGLRYSIQMTINQSGLPALVSTRLLGPISSSDELERCFSPHPAVYLSKKAVAMYAFGFVASSLEERSGESEPCGGECPSSAGAVLIR